MNGREIRVCADQDPAALPWKELGVDIVVESTGLFSDTANASKHLQAGAKKVIITAPAKNPDATLVLGVNDEDVRPGQAPDRLQRLAAPPTAWPPRSQGAATTRSAIERGFMTTMHSYTNDQTIHDFPHKDLRRARARRGER